MTDPAITLTQPEKPKILIVDDRPENLYALVRLLNTLDIEVIQAQSGIQALELVLENEFFAAIIDIQMPDMDGYELAELLRSFVNTQSLPLLFISAIYSDEYHHRKAYDTGAVDFISKPFIPEILLSKIKVFLDLYQKRKSLEYTNRALNQANLDKDKFLSIISHDLRAPFNAILGYAQLLEIQATNLDGESVLEMAHNIHHSAKIAYNLVDSLLEWSRLQRNKGLAIEKELTNLASLVEDALEVLEPTASMKEIKLFNMVSPEASILADRRMIDTVIRNLVSNALKFTPRHGCVTISAFHSQDDFAGRIILAVQDTGIGMSPEKLASLFKIDENQTTPGTEQEPGTGLGLIICQEMVERHGGQIWVESQENVGTTIYFTVPDGKSTQLAPDSQQS